VRGFPRSLRWQTLIVLVAALVLSQATAVWLMQEYVTQPRVMQNIRLFVSHLKTINAALQTMTGPEQQAFIARMAELDGIRISPVRGDENMRPARASPGLQLFRERMRETFGPEAEVYVRNSESGPGDGATGTKMLWVRLPASPREYWVAFPRGRAERDPATAYILWAAVGLLIALLATFVIVWRLNRPLGALARAAARIGSGANPPPLSETGPIEVRAVARAFNQMNEDLQKNERERATFLAGISHDLRTPLARMRLEVEMLDGKVEPATRRGMVEDLDDMNAIIDQFIDFTRSESAEPLSPVNLSELARACAERAARAGAQVRCELADLPPLPLRPLSMQRLIDNLLGNAQRHAGGEVVLKTTSEAGGAQLCVLDRGPGIPPDLVDHLKQPFTKRDEARGGSAGAGLGLAIANRVAVLHGGRLDLLPREGGGLEARLTLPPA
jgi:two-component system osmolarity sensor histidine kinase EnvZ